jgi:hypothetical protein
VYLTGFKKPIRNGCYDEETLFDALFANSGEMKTNLTRYRQGEMIRHGLMPSHFVAITRIASWK